MTARIWRRQLSTDAVLIAQLRRNAEVLGWTTKHTSTQRKSMWQNWISMAAIALEQTEGPYQTACSNSVTDGSVYRCGRLRVWWTEVRLLGFTCGNGGDSVAGEGGGAGSAICYGYCCFEEEGESHERKLGFSWACLSCKLARRLHLGFFLNFVMKLIVVTNNGTHLVTPITS